MKIHCVDECKLCCGTGRSLETFETCPECGGNGTVDIFIPIEIKNGKILVIENDEY